MFGPKPTASNHAFAITSSTYKSHIFQGFSKLQQNDEFVDMTLAAEGHWVKVHQMLVALSSSYFKELLQSIPCQHPTIYLKGVSSEVLGFMLEYLYTGQVEIPVEKVQSFLNTAEELKIAGLMNVAPHTVNENLSPENQTRHVLRNIRYQTPSPADIAINEENITITQLQEPTIKIPVSANENISGNHLPYSINMPILSGPITEIQNVKAPADNIYDVTLDQSATSDNIITDNMYPPTMKAPVLSDGCPKVQDIHTKNAPSKIINITFSESAENSNNTQKPVAKIEIVSNTVINSNTNVGQLPQLYSEAFANFNNQNATTDQGANMFMNKSAHGTNKDISKLLDIEDVVMAEDNNADYLDTPAQSNTISTGKNNSDNTEEMEEVQKNKDLDTVFYISSNRGALQLIMNGFMYNCHYQRDNGRQKRWRCIDYRDAHCQAAVDTVGEEIVQRKNKHCHPNHQEKIKRKLKRQNIVRRKLQVPEDSDG